MNSWTEELLRAVAIGFLIAAAWILAASWADHRLDDFQLGFPWRDALWGSVAGLLTGLLVGWLMVRR